MNHKEIAADIAKELAEHPERWCQRAFAKDDMGQEVSSRSPDAVSWCLLGHVIKRTRGLPSVENEMFQDAFREAARDFTGTGMMSWNDRLERTVDEVITLCKKVAE